MDEIKNAIPNGTFTSLQKWSQAQMEQAVSSLPEKQQSLLDCAMLQKRRKLAN